MTKVHLDTCFLIRALVPGSDEDKGLRDWLARRVPIAISSVAWAEFLCGPLRQEDRVVARRLVGSPVAFSDSDADIAARFFNRGGRRRGSFVDCLIAAAAAREHAALATGNPDDFHAFVEAGLELAGPKA